MAACIVAALVLLPVIALGWESLTISPDLWSHLISTVLPAATLETVLLLLGVGLLVSSIGTVSAWLVTAYDFPGRRIAEWALLLPLAVPTYIIAYAYLDILHPLGVVQTLLRDMLGYDSPRDFRLPDIRSLTGCILLLGFVLYPYVYITTRAMFLTQAGNLLDAARMLGVKRSSIFWRIALPLARPAIAVGMSLALMETLNDVGASEFLGVRTLTISIYTTWVVRSDLAGAAQISLALVLVVLLLVSVERHGRRHLKFFANVQRATQMAPKRLGLVKGLFASAACFAPVVIGFVAPAIYLAVEAVKRVRADGLSNRITIELLNTIALATAATMVVLVLGIAVAAAARLKPGGISQACQRMATLGYALPGTVLAIGILSVTGAASHMLNAFSTSVFGMPTGLILISSGAALVYAYSARFLAISVGSMEAGLSRMPTSYDMAARSLGAGVSSMFRDIHLPLSKTALASAGILVFVDCMKELPAALLLRPLNIETLATHIYGEAARGTYEEAAVAALAIVIAGIVPVVLLARVGSRKPL